MPKVPVYNLEGQQVDEIELSDAVFAAPVNHDLLHQAVVMYEANRRVGTAATKTRGMVSGGGRKIWRQKGLGRARQGSIRAPHWRKGGVVFGPQPRSYRLRMPKKMRRAALRAALSAKLRDGELLVVDRLTVSAPRTREMRVVLEKLGVAAHKPLLVLGETDPAVRLAARNLEGVEAALAEHLNARQVLVHGRVVLTRDAVRRVEEVLAS